MAGIYVHIPLCKSRCSYCAFYSTTDVRLADALVEAICCELRARRQEVDVAHTIYFGGGTPTMLSVSQLGQIISTIRSCYAIAPDAEITIEANPGDFHVDGKPQESRLKALAQLGFNRLSLGVQSFQDEVLRRIGRRHDAQQAIETIRMAQANGFCNISVDLIYGLPGMSRQQWIEDIRQAIALGVPHISGYGLSVEDGTRLYQEREQGLFQELCDEEMNERQLLLGTLLKEAGIAQYEVSNYAKEGFHSRHNSSYWTGAAYLGIGPAAHSYDGKYQRRWNNADLAAYIRAMQEGGNDYFQTEQLTENDCCNEAIMLGLRTTKGIHLIDFEKRFGTKRYQLLLEQAEPYLLSHKLEQNSPFLHATTEGMQILNTITADLFG